MILKGSQRGGAGALAQHLLRLDENDHVEVHELRGFSGETLRSALQEIAAISKGTSCRQFLFSLSLNPPGAEDVSVASFFGAITRAEEKLGLTDQPRAVVFHEKEGRRHAHVVWSRIDAEKMVAIHLPYFKTKLNEVAKQLYLDHGWRLPEGFRDRSLKDPLTFSREEWQQAKRAQRSPAELKATLQECWAVSDNRASFERALQEKGFWLARGDRRGFVAMDWKGEVYSLSRWTGQKPKELALKLGNPASLPGTMAVRDLVTQRMTGMLKGFVREMNMALEAQRSTVIYRRTEVKDRQQAERARLTSLHEERQTKETQARAGRFRKGLLGLWDWLSGRSKETRQQNEREASKAQQRDQRERESMVFAQLGERRVLQQELQQMKADNAAEVARLDEDMARWINRAELSMHEQGSDIDRVPAPGGNKQSPNASPDIAH